MRNVCLVVVLIVLLSLPLPLALADEGIASRALLRQLGIDGPFLSGSFEGLVATTQAYSAGGVDLRTVAHLSNVVELKSTKDLNTYYTVEVENADGFLTLPGKPALPFKSYVFKVPGNVKDKVVVGLVNVEVELIKSYGKVMPTPEPLAYCPSVKNELTIKEDASVYLADKFYPGRILDYYVGYGLGGYTYVIVKIYPVQYNPVKNALVIVKSAYFSIIHPPTTSYSAPSGETAVIITSTKLLTSAGKLKALYEGVVGVKTDIVAVEVIDVTYPPAEPITMYPGFYTYPTRDDVYTHLANNYNWALALKIISYLRDVSKHPDLKYVTILGDALTVPPSFYYFSLLNYYYIGPWDGWVPTDYFYSSPDYDLIPDYIVGRIPFSDPSLIDFYIGKLSSWYAERKGDWLRNLIVSGGYPFLLSFMFGESILSTESMLGTFDWFNAKYMLRTEGNYNSETVKRALQEGNAIWYFALAHGFYAGIGDYVLVAPTTPAFEVLATIRDLMRLKPYTKLPVVASVACQSGAWDTALLGAFCPYPGLPSFGETVLLSSAAGIAYVGSARVAWEYLWYPRVVKGLLLITCAGATRLHLDFIKAYSNFMGAEGNVSLGDVIYLGYLHYIPSIELMDPEYREYVGLVTIFGTYVLGDPLLQLPTYVTPPTVERVVSVSSINQDLDVPATLISGSGTLPFYRIDKNGTVVIRGVGETALVTVTRVFQWIPTYEDIFFHMHVRKDTVKIVGGTGIYVIPFDEKASGYLRLNVKLGPRLAVFVLSSAGVSIEKQISQYQPAKLKGCGIDFLTGSAGYISLDLIIGGWYVGPQYPEWSGKLETSIAVPFGLGNYSVEFNIPNTLRSYVASILKILSTSVSVVESDRSILSKSIAEVSEGLSGKLAEVNVSIASALALAKADLLKSIDKVVGRVDSAFKDLSELTKSATASIQESISAVRRDLDSARAELLKSIGDVSKTISVAITDLNKLVKDTASLIQASISTAKADILDSISKAKASISDQLTSVSKELKSATDAATTAASVAAIFAVISVVLGGVGLALIRRK